jgi:hypothetical protein
MVAIPSNTGPSSAPAAVSPRTPLAQQGRYLAAYNRIGRPRLAVLVADSLKDSLSGADLGTVALDLTDWLSCTNRVPLLDPATVRRALTAEQIGGLEQGTLHDLADVGKRLKTDVIVVVRPEKTGTPEIRLSVLALNTRDGLSIASAQLNVPVPMDGKLVDRSTRTIAGKLMEGMTGTWSMMLASGPAVPPGTPPISPPERPLLPTPPVAPPVPPAPPEQPLPPAPPQPPQIPITPPSTQPQPVPPQVPPFQPQPPTTVPT